MVIILALCIPLTAVVVGFLTLQSVRLGLKWQIQTNKEEIPTLEVKNPMKSILESDLKQKNEQTNILNEWLHGESESR